MYALIYTSRKKLRVVEKVTSAKSHVNGMREFICIVTDFKIPK